MDLCITDRFYAEAVFFSPPSQKVYCAPFIFAEGIIGSDNYLLHLYFLYEYVFYEVFRRRAGKLFRKVYIKQHVYAH